MLGNVLLSRLRGNLSQTNCRRRVSRPAGRRRSCDRHQIALEFGRRSPQRLRRAGPNCRLYRCASAVSASLLTDRGPLGLAHFAIRRLCQRREASPPLPFARKQFASACDGCNFGTSICADPPNSGAESRAVKRIRGVPFPHVQSAIEN